MLTIFVGTILYELSIVLKLFALHKIDGNSILCTVWYLKTMKMHSKSSADSVFGPIFFRTEFWVSLRGSTIYWKSRKDPGNQRISTNIFCVKKISSKNIKYKYVNVKRKKKIFFFVTCQR